MLERYISKTVFAAIAIALFILVSLSGIIKFADQLKKADHGTYNAIGAGIYTLLSIPKDIYIFFPMASLLGVIVGLGILAQRNELVIMQTSGFTRMHIALSVMKAIIPSIILTIAIGEWISPQSEQIARNYRAKAMYNGSVLSTHKGIWAKDCNDFVHIENINKNNELKGISIYTFNSDYHLQSIRYASFAKFDNNKKQWLLLKVVESNLENPKQISLSRMTFVVWQTDLTPDKLEIVALSPDVFSINDLYKYIKYLKSSKQNTDFYQFIMWSKIFQPISEAVMTLIAISFIFGPLRSVSVGVRIVTSISLGFLFYILNKILGPLMLVYNVTPIIDAFLPSLVFFLISLWMLLKY